MSLESRATTAIRNQSSGRLFPPRCQWDRKLVDSSYFTKEHSRGKETHLLAPPGLRHSGRIHEGYPHPSMTHAHSLSAGCHTKCWMCVCNSTEEGTIITPRLWTRTLSCRDTMSHNKAHNVGSRQGQDPNSVTGLGTEEPFAVADVFASLPVGLGKGQGETRGQEAGLVGKIATIPSTRTGSRCHPAVAGAPLKGVPSKTQEAGLNSRSTSGFVG